MATPDSPVIKDTSSSAIANDENGEPNKDVLEHPGADEDGLDSDSDLDDKYRLEVNPERPSKQPSEKRRRDDAAYHAYLMGRESREQEEAFRKADALATADDLPATSFLNNNAIICSPREYQTALFERAKERNIIVVLDTGKCCCSQPSRIQLPRRI